MNRSKRLVAVCALAFGLGAGAWAQAAQEQRPAGGGAAQPDRLIGEVTAVDASARTLTVKADAGGVASTVAFDERTTFRRVPPGTTSVENAERITSADVAARDRVLVLLRAPAAGQAASPSPSARQVIVMSRASLDDRTERQREDARRRNLTGRVTAVDAARREFTVNARGPEGPVPVVVSAAGGARFQRFASDSLRPADAVASSLAEIRVGDQVRARGERSADGARFTAEEVTAGQFVRVGGTVQSVDAARGELTVKSEETGKTFTVGFGKNSTLRRVTQEAAEAFGPRRGERGERGERGGGNLSEEERRARREARRAEREAAGQQRPAGGEGTRPQRGGGGNLQQMFERLPTVALAELKKGDAILVTGTPSADQTRVTTIMLLTGEAEFLQRLQRIQERRGGDLQTGLPGDVLGGGNVQQRDPP